MFWCTEKSVQFYSRQPCKRVNLCSIHGPMVFKLWFLSQQHQLRRCQRCKFSDSTPDLLNQKLCLWMELGSLCFNQTHRRLTCIYYFFVFQFVTASYYIWPPSLCNLFFSQCPSTQPCSHLGKDGRLKNHKSAIFFPWILFSLPLGSSRYTVFTKQAE